MTTLSLPYGHYCLSGLYRHAKKCCYFDTEPEMIMRAGWHKMKIMNVPIKTIYHEDFTSYVNPVKDTIKFFKLVFNSLRWKRDFNRSRAS